MNTRDKLCCSAPVSTWKYSASHFLSLFQYQATLNFFLWCSYSLASSICLWFINIHNKVNFGLSCTNPKNYYYLKKPKTPYDCQSFPSRSKEEKVWWEFLVFPNKLFKHVQILLRSRHAIILAKNCCIPNSHLQGSVWLFTVIF